MSTHDVRHLVRHLLTVAVLAACAGGVMAAQQAAPPPQPDPVAVARQAELNKRPDTLGTGRFPAIKEEGDVTTDAISGDASFTITLTSKVRSGSEITATATDKAGGDTSEFSVPIEVQ